VKVERDGIRFAISVDRNPMPAGEPTWMTATVKNTGRDEVVWLHDGCATLVHAYGRLDPATWRPGVELHGQSRQFKRYALGNGIDGSEPTDILVGFIPKERIGFETGGCADIGLEDRIRPGETLKRRLRWNGRLAPFFDEPPAGPVQVIATFDGYRRVGWKGHQSRQLALPLTVWVAPGKAPGRLDAPEVIDAALQDPAFAGFFATKEFAHSVEDWVKFDAKADRWHVGIVEWYVPKEPQATLTYFVIDPVTGQVVDRVSRLWDEAMDGWP
jgi:hypothetical protein